MDKESRPFDLACPWILAGAVCAVISSTWKLSILAFRYRKQRCNLTGPSRQRCVRLLRYNNSDNQDNNNNNNHNNNNGNQVVKWWELSQTLLISPSSTLKPSLPHMSPSPLTAPSESLTNHFHTRWDLWWDHHYNTGAGQYCGSCHRCIVHYKAVDPLLFLSFKS